ncbi:hypothetical protein [Helicobacter rodentium]|uniref:hypothetical protein n=1 Tax=Helicobacter rodentium TaxID=59617 RepID=UPI0012EC6E77|nr:hypothetical protein [Helicobacter rodentium]
MKQKYTSSLTKISKIAFIVFEDSTSVLANASVAIHNPIYRRLCNGGFKAI